MVDLRSFYSPANTVSILRVVLVASYGAIEGQSERIRLTQIAMFDISICRLCSSISALLYLCISYRYANSLITPALHMCAVL
jgi:hypothetical protein